MTNDISTPKPTITSKQPTTHADAPLPQKPTQSAAAPAPWHKTVEYSNEAKLLALSQFIPSAYRGKPADCEIALDISRRTSLPPLMVMQNLYIVNGKPAWSGQACGAIIKASARYERDEIIYVGEPGAKNRGAYMQAYDVSLKKMVRGVTVTIQMAEDEGWLKKDGSKWKTMPDLMLAYRALAFFARVYLPNAMMGLRLPSEREDMD